MSDATSEVENEEEHVSKEENVEEVEVKKEAGETEEESTQDGSTSEIKDSSEISSDGRSEKFSSEEQKKVGIEEFKREPDEAEQELTQDGSTEELKQDKDESLDGEGEKFQSEGEKKGGEITIKKEAEKDEGELKHDDSDIEIKVDKDEPSDADDEKSLSEKSLDRHKVRRIRNSFARPIWAEPKHPIFSSPFARRISSAAFGPKKPKWYIPLTSNQLYLFKDILNCVEIGRGGMFRFDDFLEALQDFDHSVTREEVLNILDSMETDEFEELDFGKFLFLLAYRDSPSEVHGTKSVEKLLSTSVVTPRQCLILSAIAYYVLIASPEEIERYYIANTRRKATVLHFHMEAARLGGLTEKQMEEKQKTATAHLGPLFAITGSPYACPVPFVPRSKKTKVFKKKTSSRLSSSKTDPKKSKSRPTSRDAAAFKTKDDKTYYDMHYGRLPMPMLNIPEKKRMEMRKKCTVEMKDYITQKAYEAKEEYRERLKKATVLYNIRSLETILKKGFPSESERNDFIEVYKRYMPLTIEDIQNFSLWVKPAGYEVKHKGKPLYPDKFAFGSKIP